MWQRLYWNQIFSFHTWLSWNGTNSLWIKLWHILHRWSFCFSTSVCSIHSIDQPKTITFLLKSKIPDFETLRHVNEYLIEYISYLQGLYVILIISAADRIIPALVVVSYNYVMYLIFWHFSCKHVSYKNLPLITM